MLAYSSGTSYIDQAAMAARAEFLFCATYGLSWSDAWVAAAIEARHGAELTGRILRLVSLSGCTVAEAASAISAQGTTIQH